MTATEEKIAIGKGCHNEFQYFGASYPDARCMDGKYTLWEEITMYCDTTPYELAVKLKEEEK
ncbi:MAG: hypothetical protein MJY60_04130 [Bacteroidales bacterium]|nr:hypothetical protein [Bacteroidales bacterium]